MYEDELDEFELEDEFEDEFEDDDEEVYEELAAELLEIEDEEELEEFFGSLIKAASSFLRSPVGRSLVKKAKSVARRALPTVAGAVGGAAGRHLGRYVASRFEVDELEFEAAKRVVKTVCTAAKQAAKTQSAAPPATVAKKAMAKAVKKHKPTLPLTGSSKAKVLSRSKIATGLGSSYRGGRWVRRGRNIIVMGM